MRRGRSSQGAGLTMAETFRETWEQKRQRMLDETSRFIEWGLRHPEQVIPIPTKAVGAGGFPSKVGQWFWTVVLVDRPTARWRRWRSMLMGRFP